MAEDYQIQQGATGVNPWVPTIGAAGGAAVGGVGAHYFTRPKYGSFEDIMAEAKDSTDFSSKIENAEGEEKTFLEEAKKLATKQADAEAEYDRLLEEYKKNNAGAAGKVETEEYKKLVEAEQNAQKILNDKKTALINEKVAELKNATKTEQVKIEDAVNRKVKQLVDNIKYLEKLQAQNAPKEKIDAVTARIRAIEGEMNEFAEKVAEKLDYGKLRGDALIARKEQAAEAFKDVIQARKEQRLRAWDAPLESDDAKLVKRYTENRNAVKKQEAELDQALGKMKDIIGKDAKALYERDSSLLAKKIKTAYTIEKNHLAKLAELQQFYNEAVRNTSTTTSIWDRILQAGRYVMDGKPINTTQDLKDYLTRNLNDAQKADINKLLSGELTEEKLNEAIKKATARRDAIQEATSKIQNARREILRLDAQYHGTVNPKTGIVTTGIKDDIAARGAYVKDGKLIDKNTNKPIKPASVTPERPAKVNLPSGTKIPKDATIEFSSKTATNLSEEELKKQAEALVKPDAYKEQTSALEAAKNAREEGYKKLADKPAKTPEELAEAFTKEKGAKPDYVKKQGEKATEEFKTKFKSQFERRYGFAEHTNAKIAGVAALGAVLVGGLAYLMAPKNKG